MSLYDFRQSPKNQIDIMHDNFSNISFHFLKEDPCVYTFKDGTNFAILVLHVDEIRLLPNNKQLIGKQKKAPTDLRDVSWVLVMNVKRDRHDGTIKIEQHYYMKGILECYGMMKCRPSLRRASNRSSILIRRNKNCCTQTKAAVPVDHRHADVRCLSSRYDFL